MSFTNFDSTLGPLRRSHQRGQQAAEAVASAEPDVGQSSPRALGAIYGVVTANRLDLDVPDMAVDRLELLFDDACLASPQ